MSVNKVILLGNVGRDPETRVFENGQVSNFSLATTERGYKLANGTEIAEKTEWHNIVAWNGLSKVVDSYVTKGKPLFIEGKIRTRSYDDATGNKKYVTEVVADTIELLGGKGDNFEKTPQAHSAPLASNSATSNDIPSIKPPTMTNSSKPIENTSYDDIDDVDNFGDDLPF